MNATDRLEQIQERAAQLARDWTREFADATTGMSAPARSLLWGAIKRRGRAATADDIANLRAWMRQEVLAELEYVMLIHPLVVSPVRRWQRVLKALKGGR